ncbi:hypothetical protein BBJ28_00004081 [Nothophytophthora sp. Chile5]|nr:hypothetical protein BBJ28_00004081 [Nothophytophthora sp. Chile5]
MENAQLPPSSLLIASDDCAMLEAALSFIDGCDDLPSDSEGEALGDASPSDDFVPDFVADLDRIGSFSPTGPTLDDNSDDGTSPNTWKKSVIVSKSTRRYRRTPKQEIEQLRVQELQLSRQLEQLRLQAHDSAQYGGGARLRATLPFWKKAASRQYQSRQDSQRENRRLRLLVSSHKKRAKRLQQAWRKLIDPEIRLVGRKYREAHRTVIVTRALVEPQHLEGRASVGFCFRETEVSIIASSQESPEGVSSVDHSAATTTIETHTAVNTHATGDGEALRWWKASVGGHVAQKLWQQAFAVRVNSIDDLLFEDTRKL